MKKIINKISHHPLMSIIIGSIIIVPLTIVIKDYVTKPLLAFIFSEDDSIKVAIQHIVSIIIMIILYYATYKTLDKRAITEIRIKKEGRYALLGLFLGITAISIIIFTLYILGYYRITGINSSFPWLKYLPYVFVAALWEEVMFRGILYRILENWLGTIWALIIPSIIFGIMHFFNDDPNLVSVLSATVGGLLMGILYSYRKNIWLPVFFHFSWNLSQMVWGSFHAGNNDIEQFLIVEFTGPAILTGGTIGIENSLFVFIICAILFVYFLQRTIKKDNFVRIHQVKRDNGIDKPIKLVKDDTRK